MKLYSANDSNQAQSSKLIKILAVDDEPNNLRLIENYLDNAGFEVILAKDGVEAWSLLNSIRNIELILLDRMMPNMDGMELMNKIKSSPILNKIPVIMQTAAATKEQVIEGIQSGVYYYLTKPYDEEVMLSITRAALDDKMRSDNLHKEIKIYQQMMHHVNSANLEYKTVKEAENIAGFLANCYPYPEKVVLGLSELMINAVEHGNLQIGYETKTKLLNSGKWLEEIVKRQNAIENAYKKILVSYQKTEREIILSIQDEGYGFEWQKYLEIDAERATHTHGRGIAIAKLLSFDEIIFKNNGNTVICINRLS